MSYLKAEFTKETIKTPQGYSLAHIHIEHKSGKSQELWLNMAGCGENYQKFSRAGNISVANAFRNAEIALSDIDGNARCELAG